jgi:RimJ/RimL family protein N-acetyltransferase
MVQASWRSWIRPWPHISCSELFRTGPAHGAAKGLGRQLVDLALSQARQRPGVEVVTLTVTEGNDPAIALYEAAGFRNFGIEPMAIRTPAASVQRFTCGWPFNSVYTIDFM